MKEALFYSSPAEDVVQCHLCPHSCRLRDGEGGKCRVRRNRAGMLQATSYGSITSMGMDPMEKKPLYHFYPGSEVLSVGSSGCSLTCQFCQNWSLVHEEAPPTARLSVDQLVERCLVERERNWRCIGLAFTYSEPLVWYEYVREAAQLAKGHDLKTVLITNGYVQEAPWQELLPWLDAVNIDVKSFSEDYYRHICRGSLAPVKEAVRTAHQRGVHVEVTTLLVEGLNDSEDEVRGLARWLSSVGQDVPLHLSRYFPAYQMDRPATSVASLERAKRSAREYLHYVYVGNIWGWEHHSTFCPRCESLLIARKGLAVYPRQLEGRICSQCGWTLPIVGHVEETNP